ncbi:transcription factor TGA9-like isoform X2 [Solanum dulcamara]|uniref:transcription factor TGA9-like isoform X2 n=1 Tax=Solanum dulcamara TaxID=45834 RepID=UPI002486C730|nr:transcription factor TGA9-like isoform X2 [Solanum dulcamara]
MESQRIGDTSSTLSVDHNMSYNTSFMYHSTLNNQEPPAFDFGELEEAIVLQGVKMSNDDSIKSSLYGAATNRPAATLEMFPSWPTRFHHTQRGSSKSRGREQSSDSDSALNTTISSRGEANLELESPISQQQQQFQEMTSDSPRTGVLHTESPSKSNYEKRKGAGSTSDRVTDAKTLRRLAQNREAARKSRLRKKAYVQQLETSRIRLAQLEQELQRARSQGLFMGGAAGPNISSGAAMFDMEYSRWLDDDQRQICELRTALQAHLGDGDLRIIVDAYIAHYDHIFLLKGVAAQSDVLHLLTGIWASPVERCFLWLGGFRPSDLIKMLIARLDPLTQQQVVGIYSLQQSSQQAEAALSQGLEQLQQSLIETIATGSVNDGMHHMAVALGKLANLENFVRQADNLRQQTLHQLHRILTIRQAARCFMMIGEYYGRLRALSSLWASRPRETMMADDNSCQTSTELQMIQASQHHFSNM